jgi:putative thiamine transport system ATP-binding protein
VSGGLALDGVEIWRDRERLVALDLRIPPGEVLTVMGPSGSGKSTLLAAVLGDLPPAFRMGGRIRLDGSDITDLPVRERRIGILFQDDILFPHLSVAGNLAFGLPRRIRGRKARRARIDAALAEVGLSSMADRDPATLSGGQRARVSLLRTLLAEPRALLLDEPFGSLDAELRDTVRRIVFSTASSSALPVILVTHDPGDAEAAGGRVVNVFGQSLVP